MPLKNDSPHRHLDPAPKPQRKSRPKFELPVETESAPADVGWVYREPLAAAAAVPEPEVRDRSSVVVMKPLEKSVRSPDIASLFVRAGIGFFGLGILTAGLTSLAVLSVMSGPLLIAGRFLTPSDR